MSLLPTEYDEQCILHKWLKFKRIDHFATTNENNTYKQNKKYAMLAEVKAKASGKLKGVSDLEIFIKEFTLYLELKRQPSITKTGKISYKDITTSESQINFLEMVNKYKYKIGFVAYGAEEAINIIEKLMKLDSIDDKKEVYNKICKGIYLNCRDKGKKFIKYKERKCIR